MITINNLIFSLHHYVMFFRDFLDKLHSAAYSVNRSQIREDNPMDKFIPYEKLSKKKKRQLDAEKRGSWYGLNPITRKPKNPKAYDRKKARCWRDDSSNVLSSYVEVGAVSIQLFNAPSIISHHQ